MVLVTPEPGSSRAEELRQSLLEHTRFLVALEEAIPHGRKHEARLIRDLADELRREQRGPGRRRKLFALDLEEGISSEQLEQVRQVIRLSLRGVSANEIAGQLGISRRQVVAILGEKGTA